MLRDQEFLETNETFRYVNLSKEKIELDVKRIHFVLHIVKFL